MTLRSLVHPDEGHDTTLVSGMSRDSSGPDVPSRSSVRRRELWTPRVWPGAVLVNGDVVGTWRRAGALVSMQPWPRLSMGEREAVELEAESFPLPDVRGRIRVRWDS